MARNTNTPSDIVEFAEQVLGVTGLTEYQKQFLRDNAENPNKIICTARRTSFTTTSLILDEFSNQK